MNIRISKRSAVVILIAALLVVPAVAFASHQFDDVSDTGTHTPGIEWLAASGVTAGCGNNNYCPGDSVTRAQMATFMYRLSGNASGIAPSVNAASVDGMDVVTEAIAVSIPFGESRTLATSGPLTIFANCTQNEGGFCGELGKWFVLGDVVIDGQCRGGGRICVHIDGRPLQLLRLDRSVAGRRRGRDAELQFDVRTRDSKWRRA